jgi:sterol desaturase/sphingolipid hydroxylase (fatty acid hydroxylase superfamily)
VEIMMIDWITNAITTLVDAQMSGQGFVYMLGYFVSAMLIERVLYLFQERHHWNEADARANILNGIVSTVGEALVGAVLFVSVYLFLFEHLRLFTIPLLWWGWLLAFLLNDLAYYVDHRIAHRTGFFWALHHSHHSSNEMNLLVAQRGNVFMLGGLMQPAYLVLALLGLPLAMLVTAKFFGNLWGIFNHTRLVGRMGSLEHVLATPSNHRVHHGSDAKYLDRNYGQVLILWDRLFGTYQREHEEPTYGLVDPMRSYRIWDIQTGGLAWLFGRIGRADHWRDRLRYLWKPPGWSHDGRHATSETIRAMSGDAALDRKMST